MQQIRAKGANMKYTTLVFIRQLMKKEQAQLELRIDTSKEKLRQMLKEREYEVPGRLFHVTECKEPSAEENALSKELDGLERELAVANSAIIDFISQDWR
jgi:hypothetical protein